jgi:hypothetical protein
MKWSMGKRVLVLAGGGSTAGNLFLPRTGSVAPPEQGNFSLRATVAQTACSRFVREILVYIYFFYNSFISNQNYSDSIS